MKCAGDIQLVRTIKERCRICFTCVRECPAKAIRIVEGQAEVVPERCIGCGNCMRVCSQNAKQVLDGKPDTAALLASGAPVAALVAPSFPAEFVECGWREFVGMLRALGFAFVNEVAFGADIVAERYRRLLAEHDGKRYIATTCPAIISFVEQYHPELVKFLAPVVSPMVAEARVLRSIHGDGVKQVFIGPCIAKKGEAASENVPDEVDAALTFQELRQMFAEAGITPENVRPSDFDPPRAGLGALFPLSRGLLQTAGLDEDLLTGHVVVTGGRQNFVQALREFEKGDLNTRLLEILACEGCVMGPGVTNDTPLLTRRANVSRYVRECHATLDLARFRADLDRCEKIDFTRGFKVYDQRMPVPPEEEIRNVLERMGKEEPADELNCGACGYDTCREHAVAIIEGLAEHEMCLPHSIERLHKTVKDLAASNRQLASTQEALLNSERLASMGQLAAGIAHEVNNPLGVVLMFAHLLREQHAKNPALAQDLALIVEQTDRCKKIVAGLLNFARQTKVLRQPFDVRELVNRTLQTMPPPAGVKVRVEHGIEDPVAEIDRDQIAQVLVNLITNGYQAMAGGGVLSVRTRGDADTAVIEVADTGVGTPKENLTKIFEPFFTTKQIGTGTGLGLAVSYGITKMHNGGIAVESNIDPARGPTGSTFTVTLPRRGADA